MSSIVFSLTGGEADADNGPSFWHCGKPGREDRETRLVEAARKDHGLGFVAYRPGQDVGRPRHRVPLGVKGRPHPPAYPGQVLAKIFVPFHQM
jgi:hypothetical protein